MEELVVIYKASLMDNLIPDHSPLCPKCHHENTGNEIIGYDGSDFEDVIGYITYPKNSDFEYTIIRCDNCGTCFGINN